MEQFFNCTFTGANQGQTLVVALMIDKAFERVLPKLLA